MEVVITLICLLFFTTLTYAIMMYVNKYKDYPNSCIVLYVPERDNILLDGADKDHTAHLTESDRTLGGASVLDNERDNVSRREGSDGQEDEAEESEESEEARENALNSLTEGQRDVIEDIQDAFRDPNTDSDTLQGLMDDFIFGGPLYETGYDIYERSILEEDNP